MVRCTLRWPGGDGQEGVPMSRPNPSYRRIIALHLIVLFLLVPFALGAAIGRVTPRELVANTYKFDSTRYAKVTVATLLNNHVASISIENKEDNPTDSTFAKITLRINWETVGWGDGFVNAYFIEEVVGNNTLSFNNTEASTYTDKIEVEDFDISWYDGTRPSFDTLTGMTIPEGRFYITILVDEVDNAEGDNPERKGETNAVELKVVTISDTMEIVATPTVANNILRWQLPEVPLYSVIDCKTTSKIVITSPDGKKNTFSINHKKPSGEPDTKLKGYPTGEGVDAEGYVTYDLANKNLAFRAGEKYSVDLLLFDWTNSEVVKSSTDFTFPPANGRFTAPVGPIGNFTPSFEWSYGVYASSPWISKYDLVINGGGTTQTISGITSSFYTLTEPLKAGTTFTWYAVPYYSSDNTKFFTGQPTNPATFKTPDHNQMDLQLIAPGSGTVLFAGDSYTFSFDVQLYNKASISSASWKIGAATVVRQDNTVEYTPQTASGSVAVSCTVTDSLGLAKTAGPATFQVKKPELVLASTIPSQATIGSTVTFSLSKANDLDEISWFVDGEEIGTGTSVQFSPLVAATHTIQAKAVSNGRSPQGDAIQKRVETETKTMTVIDARMPDLSITFPYTDSATQSSVLVGQSYPLEATYTTYNAFKSLEWRVNGSVVPTPWTPPSAGTYTISCTVYDIYNKATTDTRTVSAITPYIQITSPQNNEVFPLSSLLSATVGAPSQAKEIAYTLAGVPVAVNGSHRLQTAGVQTLSVSAAFWILHPDKSLKKTILQDTISLKVIDTAPPTVQLLFPTSTTLLLGAPYSFSSSASSENGIASYAWKLGAKTGSSQTLEYTPSSRGALQGSLVVRDNEQLTTSAQFSVNVVDPSLAWSSTLGTTALQGAKATYTVRVQDIDEQSIQWFVNGVAMGTGKNFSHTFLQPGTATISVVAKSSYHDAQWNQVVKEYPLSHTVQVYSSATPVLSSVIPQESWELFSGDTYAFSFQSTKPNGQVTESITINGTKFPGNSTTYTIPEGTKEVVVDFEALDSFSNIKGSQRVTCKVLNPSLSITTPKDGVTLPLTDAIAIAALAQDIPLATLWWEVDGTRLTGGNLTSFFATKFGKQTLTVRGVAVGENSEGKEVQKPYSHSISLDVIDATRPRVSLEFPQQGFRLFKGTPYTFSASALSGNTLESLSWRVGSSTFSGKSVGFTPSTRFTDESPMVVKFEATDSYGLASAAEAKVIVLEPTISLREIPEGDRIVNTGTLMEFSVAESSKDIDQYSWFINDATTAVSTGSARTYTHSMPSTRSSLKITVKGHTHGYDSEGTYGLRFIGQDSRTIEVIDTAPPSLQVGFPYANSRLAAGESYTFKASAASANGPVVIRWGISRGNQVLDTPTGSEISYQFEQAGVYTVSCEATDPYGKKSTVPPITLEVYSPTITILNPLATDVVAYDSLVELKAKVENAGKDITSQGTLSWSVDGKPQAGSTIAAGASGRHELGVEFSIGVVDPSDPTRTKTIQSSVEGSFTVQKLKPPTVTITAPQPSSVLIAGQAYAFSATITDSPAQSVNWDIGGVVRSGLQTTFTPFSRGKLAVAVSAVGNDGSTGSSSVLVDVIAPSLTITQPSPESLHILENPLEILFTPIDIASGSIESLQVFIDGTNVASSTPQQIGSTGTYKIVLPANAYSTGSHEVRLEAEISLVDSSGSLQTHRIVSPKTSFLLRSSLPPTIVDNFSEAGTLYIQQGSSMDLELLVTESKNPLQSFSWQVGEEPVQTVPIAGAPVTGKAMRSVFLAERGQVVASCTVTDVFNTVIAKRSATIKAIDPLVVLKIESSASYPYGSAMNLSDKNNITAQDVMDVTYYLNGVKLESPMIFLNKVGSNLLEVVATPIHPYAGEEEAHRVSDSVTITVKDAPKPTITVQNSLKSQIWAAGDTRKLSLRASADTSVIADNAIASVTWTIGDTTLTGEQVTYTVPAGSTLASIPIKIVVIDTQGTRQTEEFFVKLVKPRFSVSQQSFVTKQGTPFEISSSANRDIILVRWYVDDKLQSDAFMFDFPATTVGTYSIRAEGVYQTHDDQGKLVERLISGGEAISAQVYYAEKPTVSLLFPQHNDTLFAGESYTFNSNASSPNGAVALTWQVDGKTSTGLTRQYYTAKTGDLWIELQGKDQFGTSSAPLSIKTRVVNPSLQITSLQPGEVVNIFNTTSFVAKTTDIDQSSLVWKVNNRVINPETYTFPAVGTYTVSVSADIQGRLPSGQTETRSYAHSVNIEVFDNTPPSYRIPLDYGEQTLLAGQPASFSVDEVTVVYSPAIVRWTIDGVSYTNRSATYTPDGSKSEVAVSVTVTDARGGTSKNAWVLPVKNPRVGIASPRGGTIHPYTAPIFFSAGTMTSDCDTLAWILDGEVIGNGQDLDQRGIPLGLHTVELRGTSQGLGLNNRGVTKSVTSAKHTILVSNDQKPALSNFLPSRYFAMLANTAYPISFSATSPNGIAQTSIALSSESSPRDGSSTSFVPLASGNLGILFSASDSHIPLIRQLPMDATLMQYEIGKRQASHHVAGVVYNPSIKITSPVNGKVVAANTPLLLSYEAKDIQAARWEVNGYALTSNQFTPTSAGVYNIKVLGNQSTRYIGESGADSGQQYLFEDSVTIIAHSSKAPEVEFQGPQSSTTIAHTPTWIPVSIQSENTIKEVNWYVDGKKVSNTTQGLTHTFTGVGTYQVMCEVIDQYDIVERKTMAVAVVSPSLSITGPSSTTGWNSEPVMLAAKASGNTSVGYDRSSFAWLANGQEVARPTPSNGFSYAFDPSTYTSVIAFQLTGLYRYTNPAGELKSLELASETKPYMLKHRQLPTVELQRDYSAYPWLSGRTYTLSCTAESLNGISKIVWRQNGVVISEGKTATITASNWGATEITVVALDVYGQASRPIRIPVRIVDPAITIISFEDNQTVLYGETLPLETYETVAFDSVQWSANGSPIEGNTFKGEPKARPGHLISVRGTLDVYRSDWSVEPLVRAHSKRLVVVDSTPPVATIQFPATSDTLESGRAYTFTAKASSPSGKRITGVWWKIQNKVIEGETITYTPLIPQGRRVIAAEFYARDEYGFETKTEVMVPVVSPYLEIISPAPGAILATRTGSTIAVQSAGIDPSSLVVLIDGKPTTYPVGGSTIITETGTHTLQVSGISRVSDGRGILEIPIVSQGREIHVHSSRKPDLFLTNALQEVVPGARKLTVKAGEVSFTAYAVSENSSVSLEGSLDGVPLRVDSVALSETVLEGRPARRVDVVLTASNVGRGLHELQLVARDSIGQLSPLSTWSVEAVLPSVNIVERDMPNPVAMNAPLYISVTALDTSSLVYSVNGNVTDNPVAAPLDLGQLLVSVRGTREVNYPKSELLVHVDEFEGFTYDATPPEVSILSLDGGKARLFSDYTYQFEAEYTSAESVAGSAWYLNNRKIAQDVKRFEFTPSHYPFIDTTGGATLRFEVTTVQGITGSASREVEILDPGVTITNPIATPMPLFNANAPVGLRAQATDLDNIQWLSGFASDTTKPVVLTGTSGAVRFTQTGVYTLQAVGRVIGLDQGFQEVERLFESEQITVKVRDRNKPSVISSNAKIRLVAGNTEPVPVEVKVSSGNTIVSTVWKVGERVYSFDNLQSSFAAVADQQAMQGKDILQTSISCTVTDEYGMEGSVSIPCELVSGSIAITAPRQNMRVSNDTSISLSGTAPFADSVVWTLDGDEVANADAVLITESGRHTITMKAQWKYGFEQVYESSASATIEVVNSVPPAISLQFPRTSDTVLVAGLVYQFKAEAVPATGAAIDAIWWTIDGKRYNQSSSSVVFQAPASSYGRSIPVSCHARDDGGLESVTHTWIRVIDPWLALETAGSLTSFTGHQVLAAVSSREVSLQWLVDGVASGQSSSMLTTSFASPGLHTLQAVGEASATAPNGSLQTYKVQTKPVTVQVYDSAPVTITSSVPAAREIIALGGSEVGCKLFATSPNGMAFVRWTVKDAYNANVMTTQDLPSDAEFVFTAPESRGSIVYVTAEAFDAAPGSQLRKATKSFIVRTITPSIANVSLENGKNYREGTDLKVLFNSSNLSAFGLRLDGKPIEYGHPISKLKPGIHTLEIVGTYVVSDRQGNPIEQSMLQSVSFSIQRVDPPSIELRGVSDYDRLLVGETYTLYADVRSTGSSNAIVWYQKSGMQRIQVGTGDELHFTPHASGQYELVCEVTDDLGLMSQRSVAVQGVRPYLRINTFNGEGDYLPIFQGEHLNLYSHQEDISNYVWKVDGVPLLENPLWITLEPGEHTITLEGSTYALLPSGRRGNRLVSTSKTVKVYQSLALDVALEKDHVYTDQVVHAKAEFTGSLETFRTLRWYVNDLLQSVSKDARDASLRYAFNEPGSHTIRAELTDSKGVVSTSSSTVRVSAPSTMHILRPDTVVAYRDFIAEAVVMQKGRIVGSSAARSIDWKLDGILQKSGTLIPTIAGTTAGPHTLLVSMIDQLGGVASDSRTVNAIEGFTMSLPPIEEIVLGVPRTLTVVLSNIQPDIDLNQVYKDLTWIVNGREVATGLQFDMGVRQRPGVHSVQVRYDGQYGSYETPVENVTVRVIQNAMILWPRNGDTLDSLAYLEGSGESYGSYSWTVDGKSAGHGRKISHDVNLVPGHHTAQLQVDYRGNVSTSSVSFSIKEPLPQAAQTVVEEEVLQLPVAETPRPVLSLKQPASTVYAGPVRLEANLTYPEGMKALQGGEWYWTVSDSTMRQKEKSLESRTGTVNIDIPGEYLIVCTYYHPFLDDEVMLAQTLQVDSFTNAVIDLDLERTVYQYGEPLAINVRANDATGRSVGASEIQWSINGVGVDSSLLIAPRASGEHTLQGILLAQGVEVDRAQVSFVANKAPEARVVEPMTGKIVSTDDDFIARCVVTDDQVVPESSIVWLLDEVPVATGSSVILGGLESGEHTLRVSVTDVYGVSNTALEASSVAMQAYEPLIISGVLINGGYEKYLLGSGTLEMSIARVGGLDPSIVWTIRQGAKEILKSGDVVSLPEALFDPGLVTISLVVFDNDTTIMTNSYEVQIMQTASSEVVSPTPYQVYPGNYAIPVVIRWLGGSIPPIEMVLNGAKVPFATDAKELEVGYEITCTIDSAYVTSGANALSVSVGGYVSHIPVTVDNSTCTIAFDVTPAVVDVAASQSLAAVVEASVRSGVRIQETIWTSNKKPDPIGTGTTIDLASCDLPQGEQWITLHATTIAGEKFQQGFATTVLAPIEVAIVAPLAPEQTRLILNPSESVVVSVEGRDRDGGLFTGDQVRWISSQIGFVNEGLHLDLRKISDGALHEVTAIISSRHSATAMRKLEIQQPELVSEQGAQEPTPVEEGEEGDDAPKPEDDVLETPDQIRRGQEEFSTAQSLESLITTEAAPIAVVLGRKGRVEIKQNDRNIRVSLGDNLVAGGMITIPRNAYLEVFYLNNDEQLVVYADRGTYEWDSFSETWK